MHREVARSGSAGNQDLQERGWPESLDLSFRQGGLGARRHECRQGDLESDLDPICRSD